MSINKFNEFKLIVHLICIDCKNQENFHFCVGDLFNIEGDLILSEVDQINFSHMSCSSCGSFIYIDFSKIFKPEQLRRTYDRILSIEGQEQGDN